MMRGFPFWERSRDFRRLLGTGRGVWLEVVSAASCGALDTGVLALKASPQETESWAQPAHRLMGPGELEQGGLHPPRGRWCCRRLSACEPPEAVVELPPDAPLQQLFFGRYDTRLRASLNDMFSFTLVVTVSFSGL